MEPVTTGLVILAVLVALIVINMPIGFAMGISGLIGIWLLAGADAALPTLATLSFFKVGVYTWTCIPLFILMGHLALHAGFAEDFYFGMSRTMGRVPGGLAMAAAASCAGFAACSGSSLATTATIGKISIGEMKKYHYDRRLVTGCIAASGTMGSMIPPSIYIIVYCMFAEQSISKVFMAGFIPGVLEALLYMGMIWIRCAIRPGLGPAVKGFPWGQSLRALGRGWGIVALAVFVLGGIYTGFFTPTEAGALGSFAALMGGLAMRRLAWQKLKIALLESAETTIMIFVIVIGAFLLTRALALSTIPQLLSAWISGLAVPPMVIMISFSLMYIALGTFIDPMGMILLTLPVVFPVVMQLGYSPIWFGIIIIKVMEMGLITPPLGLNVYMISSVAPDVPLHDVFRGIGWFLLMDVLHLGLLLAFPILALWLPSIM
jgi:tripartite ATP-independent transporter DctM subunit